MIYPKTSFISSQVASRNQHSTYTHFTPRIMSRGSVRSVERAKIAHDLRQSIGELKDRGLLVSAKWSDLLSRTLRIQTDIEGLANY